MDGQIEMFLFKYARLKILVNCLNRLITGLFYVYPDSIQAPCYLYFDSSPKQPFLDVG